MIYLWTKMEYLVFWRGGKETEEITFSYYLFWFFTIYKLHFATGNGYCQASGPRWLLARGSSLPRGTLHMAAHNLPSCFSLRAKDPREEEKQWESKSKMQVTVFLWPDLRRDIPPLSLFFLFIRNGSSVHSRGGDYTTTWIPAGRDHWGPS